jgi:hypothetical protein
MRLYDDHCVFDPSGHELRTNIKMNALKTVLLMLVYSYFLSFMASIHHIKTSKYTNLF